MNSEKIIQSLARFAMTLPAVVENISDDDARWKPPDGAWSILEIVMHLLDEETSDFRPRLQRTLAEPQQEWESIDPEGWAVQRRYNEKDPAEALRRFLEERRRSLDWLRKLDSVEWTRAKTHPKLGRLRAGDLLVAWAAHDALHLRQISKRLYQLTQRDAGGFSPGYAGALSG